MLSVQRFITCIAISLCMLVLPVAAQAKALPKHLASFASDLNRKLATQLNHFQGSEEETEALEAAQRVLRKAGLHQWSVQVIQLNKGAESLAKPLGLDLNNAKDWGKLDRIVQSSDSDERKNDIGKLAPNDAQKQNDAVSGFDKARSALLEDYAKRHVIEVGRYGSVTIAWNPGVRSIRVSVSGQIEPGNADSEYLVTLMGSTQPELELKGNHITYRVVASDPGVSVLPPKRLKEVRASIMGKWKTDNGEETWEIAPSNGVTNEDNDAANKRDKRAQAKEELAKLKQQKVYIWKDKDGKKIEQKKFKKLGDDHQYVGEGYAGENTQARIKELQQQIASHKTENLTKPVDREDPTESRLGIKAETQPLHISVSSNVHDDHQFTYDKAHFDGKRITASRTLKSPHDIIDLPDTIINKLIASWSPPEWIELEVLPEPKTGEVTLEGVRWRLHVTYSGMSYEIDSIHTPFSKPLRLVRKGTKTAAGAAEQALP